MHRGLCKEKPEWKGMEIIKEMHTIAVNYLTAVSLMLGFN